MSTVRSSIVHQPWWEDVQHLRDRIEQKALQSQYEQERAVEQAQARKAQAIEESILKERTRTVAEEISDKTKTARKLSSQDWLDYSQLSFDATDDVAVQLHSVPLSVYHEQGLKPAEPFPALRQRNRRTVLISGMIDNEASFAQPAAKPSRYRWQDANAIQPGQIHSRARRPRLQSTSAPDRLAGLIVVVGFLLALLAALVSHL